MNKKEKKLEYLEKILERKKIENIRSFTDKCSAIRGLFVKYNDLSTQIPNKNILLSNFVLDESVESSVIENIVTTKDKLFKHIILHKESDNNTREAYRYALAVKHGFDLLKKGKKINIDTIVSIQRILMNNNDGIRHSEGTVLQNHTTGEIVYTPPDDWLIYDYLYQLEDFITNKMPHQIDVFIKMAIIHHHFETIHPFYDGNGRTGRIINVLYLCQEGFLKRPTLYMSKYINQTKSEYYKLLQDVRDNDNWEEWISYMLEILYLSLKGGIEKIEKMIALIDEATQEIKNKLPKIYSKELVDNIFTYPYTKYSILAKDINLSEKTARRYLSALGNNGFLMERKHRLGLYYINQKLMILLRV